jgi:anti-anti-sigma factor
MSLEPLRNVRCLFAAAQISPSRLFGDQLSEALRDELLAFLEQTAARDIILDLSQVRYLSSAGISPLLALNKAMHERGGRLILVGMTPDVEGVLAATRLISTGKAPAPFEHQPDIPSAAASLFDRPSRGAPGA